MEKEYLEMILEDINGKFDLVLEGQESLRRQLHGVRDELSETINLNSFAIKTLSQKIDTVSENLDAHRRDTEMHHGYQVREE